jgi:putative SOS response-associated peptidase YedK
MCGRYTLTLPGEILAEVFGLDEVPELAPRYNIAPTQDVAAVRRVPAGAPRSLSMLRWGLVPAWQREPRNAALLINARAESLQDKPAFREAFERRRCLIPADGFYEWSGASRQREAWLIKAGDGRPFAFAGLWEPPAGREPGHVGTCAIVTTEPNALMKPIHDRMPVILPETDWNAWLDPDNRSARSLRALLRPFPSEALTALRVGPTVNHAGNETPDCIKPAPEPQQRGFGFETP